MVNDKTNIQELIQKGKELSNIIIENSQDCIKILDLEGRLKFMNQGGQRLLEIEDITMYLNESWVDFWKGEDYKAALGAISEAKKGSIGAFRGYCPSAKGTPKWWDIIISPIPDAAGHVEYLLSISRDITKKKKKKDQILNLSGLLRCIRRVNRIIVYEKEPQILIQKVCDTVIKIRGIFCAWIVLVDQSGNFLTFAQTGMDDDFQPIVDRLKCGDWPSGLQTALTQKDMVIIQDPSAVFAGCPLVEKYSKRAAMIMRLGYHGNIYGGLVISIPKEMADDREVMGLMEEIGEDISFGFYSIDLEKERDHSRKLLEKNKEKYRRLVKNLPGFVYKGYPDWSVEFFDNKIEVLTGYGADEFNSKKLKWLDIIINEDFETVRNSFIKALKTDGSFVREYRIKSKTKDVIWIQERGQIVWDTNGNTDFVSGVFFDITDRKRSDEEKKKLEIQLRQAQKMEAIGTLTSGIAHDFNNLLTTIIGYSEFALDELRKDTPLYKNIEEILHAGQRSAALTRQLLAFSRKQTIQPELLNLNDILKKTQKMLRRIIGEDIELQANFFSDLWNINADPVQMDQILMNLSVNARDAMPNGGKLIIETSNVNLDEVYFQEHAVESIPGPYVMMSVTDTGTGMDKETCDRIFEPFFTTKALGRGTGLGLSTVYGIVKQNRGHIWVYSEPGVGSTFKVYLPAVKTDVEALEKKKRISKEHLKGSETILIVEDDDMLRTLTDRILKSHGYTVISASNGSDGLKISDNHEDAIHLLLTDVIMPGINGRELAEQIKIRRPEIKIAYMTGYADRSVFDLSDADTDVSIISKPFSPEDLLTRIRKILD